MNNQHCGLMDSKILSICIPTYNRERALERLLGNLEQEINGLEQDVEICISDNCSTDGTPGVLENWKEKLPLVLHRNSENMGYDRNLLSAIQIANGKYMWIMGDDDRVINGSLAKLVLDLKKHADTEFGVISINAKHMEKWIMDFDYQDFRVYGSEEKLPPLHIGFMGCVCLNKRIVDSIIANDIELSGNNIVKKQYSRVVLNVFFHTFLFLESLRINRTVGIEPWHGIEIISDGEIITYEKKIMLTIVIMKYALEVLVYYPDFRENYSSMNYVKQLFSLTALIAERPEYRNVYELCYEIVFRILEINKDNKMPMLFRALKAAGDNRLGIQAVKLIHDVVRKNRYSELNPEKDNNPQIYRSIEANITHAEQLLRMIEERKISKENNTPLKP